MQNFIGELLGTFILVLLGNGVVAANVLKGTKEEGTGWNAIVWGWGMAVVVAVYVSGLIGPAHLNPAVTLAMAATGNLNWVEVPLLIVAQILGAMLAAVAVWLHYYPHFKKTTEQGLILASFSTGPAVRHTPSNLFGEMLGTAVLVITVMSIGPNNVVGGFGPLIVGLVVVAIGYSLGATTGYAVNPARDLGPRIVHAFLPIPNKGESDWQYSWIPVLGPIVGGVVGALLYQSILMLVIK